MESGSKLDSDMSVSAYIKCRISLLNSVILVVRKKDLLELGTTAADAKFFKYLKSV
jgi:hypothetical protein